MTGLKLCHSLDHPLYEVKLATCKYQKLPKIVLILSNTLIVYGVGMEQVLGIDSGVRVFAFGSGIRSAVVLASLKDNID